MKKLTLGFSPCPNDTFIFDAMVNKDNGINDIEYEFVMEDVETLNHWAKASKLDITKLSYSTYLKVVDDYELLDCGSALGNGVGPLLITTKEKALQITDLESFINNAKIAIPGVDTTANLLLTLAYPNAIHKSEVLFSDIEQFVLEGTYDCGLIIHESRFTYKDRGLEKLLDCGEWWEKTSGAAIPLGGIVVKRSLPTATKAQILNDLQSSLKKSWDHYPQLTEFIRDNAQEMEEAVMRKHIDLYVNEYTTSLGTVGHNAIKIMFEKAFSAGLIKNIPEMYL